VLSSRREGKCEEDFQQKNKPLGEGVLIGQRLSIPRPQMKLRSNWEDNKQKKGSGGLREELERRGSDMTSSNGVKILGWFTLQSISERVKKTPNSLFSSG